MNASRDLTSILLETTAGSPQAADQLFTLLYDELRERATALLRRERHGHTLRSTDLVHEAYLRLADPTRCQWQDRAHFLAVASRAMRRILVDHARRRGSRKRGSDSVKVSLDETIVIGTDESDHVLASLEEALERLTVHHSAAARVVEMKFFGGLTFEECGCVLGVTPRTISKYWRFAQAWLFREMSR
jgi:RNA polymerase sigma factor (TIGR02999 family)